MIRRFQPLLLMLLLAGAVVCCDHRETVKKPELLLTEQQMVDVMTDVYLIEAMLKQKQAQGEPDAGLAEGYYRQVFDHYGLTDSLFKENMAYYAYQPEVLERIMDSVVHRFEKEKQ